MRRCTATEGQRIDTKRCGMATEGWRRDARTDILQSAIDRQCQDARWVAEQIVTTGVLVLTCFRKPLNDLGRAGKTDFAQRSREESHLVCNVYPLSDKIYPN